MAFALLHVCRHSECRMHVPKGENTIGTSTRSLSGFDPIILLTYHKSHKFITFSKKTYAAVSTLHSNEFKIPFCYDFSS